MTVGDVDSDSDSGEGIVMEGDAYTPFKLEVMD